MLVQLSLWLLKRFVIFLYLTSGDNEMGSSASVVVYKVIVGTLVRACN